jgi:hypothetical protein
VSVEASTLADLREALRELREAEDEVGWQRNSGSGKPELAAVDRLTDAAVAVLRAADRLPAAPA